MKLSNKIDTLSLATPLTFYNATGNYEVFIQNRNSYGFSIYSVQEGYELFNSLESILRVKFLNESAVIDYLQSILAVKHPITGVIILFKDYIQLFNLDIKDFLNS